jgi:hypothetical protein
MNLRTFLARIGAAAKRLAAKVRPHEPGSQSISRRPALAPAEPAPADPADHAEDFAIRHAGALEVLCRRRMRELGIPDNRIGAYDIDFEFRRAAFFPKERTGGENSPGARINLNSGILNPELLADRFAPEVSRVWETSRLRDRMDAVIVHEDIEGSEVVNGQTFEAAHGAAIARAPDSLRPITEGARRILRAMAEHAERPENPR